MQSMTWVWAEPSTWKLRWLEGQRMVRDAGGKGGMGARGLAAGWSCQSKAKKDSQKHLLIAHSFQSITQRDVRRNKGYKRRNSDLKRLINTVPVISTHLLPLSHWVRVHKSSEKVLPQLLFIYKVHSDRSCGLSTFLPTPSPFPYMTHRGTPAPPHTPKTAPSSNTIPEWSYQDVPQPLREEAKVCALAQASWDATSRWGTSEQLRSFSAFFMILEDSGPFPR